MNKTGTVAEVFPKLCNVVLDASQDRLLCSYRRGKIVEREAEWIERSPVAPGDKVEVQVFGSKDGVVTQVFPRKNALQRRAPGREGKILHTLATNVDRVVIVTSVAQPQFSPGLVDRFLIATQKAQIPAILVINKMDMATDADRQGIPWKLYQDHGVMCLPVSSETGEGVKELQKILENQTAVFCGHSGVGKTSLLAQLVGENVGKVGEVSSSTGKGKHTTTVSKMIFSSGSTRYFDTPGIKEFGLFGIEPKELIEYFPELWETQKKREPIEGLPRYESYLKLKDALENEGR